MFEHILIMEDYLGRRLLPDENVHHRNGVSNDSGIEDLELSGRSPPLSVTRTRSDGRERSSIATRTWRHPQQRSRCSTSEHSWRWGESNPRPWATVRDFSGRSRRRDLASRLPPAEDLSAGPGAVSGGGPRAEPPP